MTALPERAIECKTSSDLDGDFLPLDLAARLIAVRFGLELDIAKLICGLAGIGEPQ